MTAEWLAALPPGVWLRQAPLAYPFVSAAHILGIGLLLGAVLPLDLRLMGAFRDAPLAVLASFLGGAAVFGLALALVTGALLFLVRPEEYLANPAFLAKLGLIALALLNAALVRRSAAWAGLRAGREASGRLRATAAASALLWLGALTAGRWIGFL